MLIKWGTPLSGVKMLLSLPQLAHLAALRAFRVSQLGLGASSSVFLKPFLWASVIALLSLPCVIYL